LLVSEEGGGEEIIAEDKSGTGAEAGLGITEDAETKGILTSISQSDESNVAVGIALPQYGTISIMPDFIRDSLVVLSARTL